VTARPRLDGFGQHEALQHRQVEPAHPSTGLPVVVEIYVLGVSVRVPLKVGRGPALSHADEILKA
jgi:hypothetical protein